METLLNSLLNNTKSMLPVLLALIILIMVISLMALFSKRGPDQSFPLCLILISFLIRLICILLIKTPITSDYEQVYNASVEFSKGIYDFNQTDYFHYYGHQTGLVIFNGTLLKIWNNPFFLELVNCLFSVGTNFILYLIAKKVLTPSVSKFAALCYAVYPFSALLNTLLSNHIVSTFFSTMSIWLFIQSSEVQRGKRWAPLILSILSLSVAYAIKTDVVIILGGFLLMFLIRFIFLDRSQRRSIVLQTMAFVFGFLFMTNSFSFLVKTSGINPSGLKMKDPFRFMVFGLNRETDGHINQADKDLILQKMNEENISLSDSEKEIIFDRLQMPLKEFVGLFIAKMVCLWKGGGVSYSMEYLEPIHPFLCKTVELFNAFMFYFLLAGMLIGIFIRIKRKNFYPIMLFCFILFVFILFYLLLEVQSRYTYTVLVPIVILSGCGYEVFDKAAFRNAAHRDQPS